MYRSADPTWKISKRTHAEIREIHRTLPVMLLFLLAESDVDGPGQRHARLASRGRIGRAKNAARAAYFGGHDCEIFVTLLFESDFRYLIHCAAAVRLLWNSHGGNRPSR